MSPNPYWEIVHIINGVCFRDRIYHAKSGKEAITKLAASLGVVVTMLNIQAVIERG